MYTIRLRVGKNLFKASGNDYAACLQNVYDQSHRVMGADFSSAELTQALVPTSLGPMYYRFYSKHE